MSTNTEIAEEIPWVTRLDEPTQCIGFKSSTPLKAIYWWGAGASNPPVGLELYRCKGSALWHFEALDDPEDKWEFLATTGTYCWPHLVHRALHGTYRESERFEAWLVEHGYVGEEEEE